MTLEEGPLGAAQAGVVAVPFASTSARAGGWILGRSRTGAPRAWSFSGPGRGLPGGAAGIVAQQTASVFAVEGTARSMALMGTARNRLPREGTPRAGSV
jgi:hypothetical protein